MIAKISLWYLRIWATGMFFGLLYFAYTVWSMMPFHDIIKIAILMGIGPWYEWTGKNMIDYWFRSNL
jgi:hypothetical protein